MIEKMPYGNALNKVVQYKRLSTGEYEVEEKQDWILLQNSDDLQIVYNSYDANKMPTQITSSSASLGLSFTENITYNGDGTINTYNRVKA